MLSPSRSLLLLATIFASLYGASYAYAYAYSHVRATAGGGGRPPAAFDARVRLNFMGAVLLLFGALKLYDLRGFASIFRRYDLISRYVPVYAFAYPFVELALGAAYLARFRLGLANAATASVMLVSIVSVVVSMLGGEKLRCGCMGSFFHIPLSYVTLSENVLMLAMVALGGYRPPVKPPGV